MRSEATTVPKYLASLPAERRAALVTMRTLVNRHLPKGYEETMAYGMIVWQVPWSVCSDTYNGQPLAYAGLASQKQYMAIYLTSVYSDPRAEREFRATFAAAGKKLDMGKSCVRFRRLEDLHLPAIAQAIAALPVAEFVRRAQAAHDPAARTAPRKSARAAKAGAGTGAAAKRGGAAARKAAVRSRVTPKGGASRKTAASARNVRARSRA